MCQKIFIVNTQICDDGSMGNSLEDLSSAQPTPLDMAVGGGSNLAHTGSAGSFLKNSKDPCVFFSLTLLATYEQQNSRHVTLLSNPPGITGVSCRAYLVHHGLKMDLERNVWVWINLDAADVPAAVSFLSLCSAVVRERRELLYRSVECHGFTRAFLLHSGDCLSVSSP